MTFLYELPELVAGKVNLIAGLAGTASLAYVCAFFLLFFFNQQCLRDLDENHADQTHVAM